MQCQAKSRWCLLQNQLRCFGVSLISSSSSASLPSTSFHPLLQLLGLTDQELQEQMAKGHIYAFNMGNDNIIPFENFKVAGKELMKRNMPEVLDGSQTEAIFIPETPFPNIPRCVNKQEYEMRTVQALQFLRINQNKAEGDLGMVRGDQAESELFMELKKCYRDKKAVVFWGPKLRLPGKDRGAHQEFDFVIVDMELKKMSGVQGVVSELC